MIELFSNFIIISRLSYECDHQPTNHEIVFDLYHDNVEEVSKISILQHINLKRVIIIYTDTNDAKHLMSILTFTECNIKKLSQFEEILVLNQCLFLK
jgi:hypothetical protein